MSRGRQVRASTSGNTAEQLTSLIKGLQKFDKDMKSLPEKKKIASYLEETARKYAQQSIDSLSDYPSKVIRHYKGEHYGAKPPEISNVDYEDMLTVPAGIVATVGRKEIYLRSTSPNSVWLEYGTGVYANKNRRTDLRPDGIKDWGTYGKKLGQSGWHIKGGLTLGIRASYYCHKAINCLFKPSGSKSGLPVMEQIVVSKFYQDINAQKAENAYIPIAKDDDNDFKTPKPTISPTREKYASKLTKENKVKIGNKILSDMLSERGYGGTHYKSKGGAKFSNGLAKEWDKQARANARKYQQGVWEEYTKLVNRHSYHKKSEALKALREGYWSEYRVKRKKK